MVGQNAEAPQGVPCRGADPCRKRLLIISELTFDAQCHSSRLYRARGQFNKDCVVLLDGLLTFFERDDIDDLRFLAVSQYGYPGSG